MSGMTVLGRVTFAGFGLGLALWSVPAFASEPNAQRVNHFVGAAGESIPIQVPAFHGIEPRLALSYSSEARNGFAGMGWNLSGVSTIEKTLSFFSDDSWTLDGQPLATCPSGSSFPSCAAGGTHFTLQESYLKIKKVSDTLWEVYGKDGTKTEFTGVMTPSGYSVPFKFGQSKVTDTHGNVVNYTWDVNIGSIFGNTYPRTITYEGSSGNGYKVEFFRETRPDPITGNGYTNVSKQTDRLKSVVVTLSSGAKIRAYKLGYATSAATAKSLLASVQMYGKDATIDGAGTISAGTALPAQSFTYKPDTAVASFGGDVLLGTAGPPATPPGTVENLTWTHLYRATTTGDGSSLSGVLDTDPDYPQSGYGTRALSSGSGYFEFTYNPAGGNRWLKFGQYSAWIYGGTSDVVFNYGGGWVGPYSVGSGQAIRIDVSPSSVQFKINGSTVLSQGTTSTYPLVPYAGISQAGDSVLNGRVSGALVNYFSADCSGTPRLNGDFNGDGRQDVVCRTTAGDVSVTLATSTGFASPTIWGWSGVYLSGAGDFNNDGKDDVVFHNSYGGETTVGLSNGTTFGAITSWGVPINYTAEGYGYHCAGSGATIFKVADFNGDGKMDIACHIPFVEHSFVASYSTGSSWSPLTSEPSCGTGDNDYKMGVADWNGDGMDDLSCIAGNSTPDMLPFNSWGYAFYASWPLQSFCSYNEYSVGDFNGDGSTDVACANNGRVMLRAPAGQWIDQGATSTFCVSGQRLTADLDGDGAAEWICNNPGAPSNDIEVRRWSGGVLGSAATWKGSFCSGILVAADFNGDGKKDLLCDSNGYVTYAGTKDTKADLLATSANGLGGSATLTWNTNTNVALSASGGVSTAGLPAKYLVVSTIANDGRLTPQTTTFQYFGGAQDDQERKFYGFQTVREILPMLSTETESPMFERKFSTDMLSAGRLLETRRWSSNQANAKIISATKSEYTTATSGGRRTALLTGSWNYQYSGLSGLCATWPCLDAKRTKVEYTYDNYGSVADVKNYGEVGADTGGVETTLSGDETFTTNKYATPNTSAYIVGLIGKIRTYQGTSLSGTLLAQSEVAYDGNASYTTAPTKGDVTSQKSWLVEESRYTTAATTTYDPYGNALSATDPTSKTASATYDAAFHLFPLSVTNGASETSTTTWDTACGIPATATDVNGLITTFTTDPLCRPATTTLPSPYGTVSTSSYAALGSPTTQKVRVETPGPDGNPSWSESYFDGFGRTYKSLSRGPSTAESIVNEVDFDARGHVWGQKSPYYANAPSSGKVTTFEYDYFDRPVKTILPDTKTRLTGYPGISTSDGYFQVTSTNELSQSSTTKMDVFGRTKKMEKVTSLHGTLVTERFYDILGRMTSVKDPVLNTWSYTYDSLGRNLTKVDPDAGTSTYKFDDAGRLTSQVDAKSQAITLEYDNVGRPTFRRVRPTGGITGTVTEYVETTYGTSASLYNKGRVTQVVTKNSVGAEQSGKLAFEYDALGRATKQTRTLDATNYAVERNYDSAGYLRGIKYPDTDILGQFGSSGTALGYDAAGRLSSIPGVLTSVTYTALGAPLVQTNVNGTTTTKTYDVNRFWLKTIGTAAPSLTIQNLSYTLNDAGMATSVDSDVSNEDWTYSYDEMNRLVSSTNGTGGAANQTWTYDSIGRFASNSKVGTFFTYPAVGNPRPHAPKQISGGGAGTLTASGALSFDYDPNGNMLIGNGRTMTWNADNLITQVVANSTTTTFEYGPAGDRIKKAQGSTAIKYPFGDDYEISGTTVTKYFNAGFGPIAKKVGSTLYWLHTDRMGSINATTDGSGAEILRRTYRSYGQLFGQTGTHSESLGYIGERTDEETKNGTTDDKGLTYLHARYMDPALGIFLSPDPAEADGNTYRYGFGNPTLYSDPSGLDAGDPDDPTCGGPGQRRCHVFPGGGGYCPGTAEPANSAAECEYFRQRSAEEEAWNSGGWSSSFWNYFFLGNSPGRPRGGVRYYFERPVVTPNPPIVTPTPTPGATPTPSPTATTPATTPTPTPTPPPGAPPNGPPGVSPCNNALSVRGLRDLNMFERSLAFSYLVESGGPMDYKEKGPYEDFGNFNYGVVGRAAGFSRGYLLNAAGLNHIKNNFGNGTGRGIPFLSGYRGDQPRDGDQIKSGVSYFDTGVCGFK